MAKEEDGIELDFDDMLEKKTHEQLCEMVNDLYHEIDHLVYRQDELTDELNKTKGEYLLLCEMVRKL